MTAIDGIVAPEQKSVRAKLARNVVFSGLRTVFLWPISLLLLPFILGKIGTTGYGVWALFLTVIGLTGLADLGVAGTLTKQVAHHYANEDLGALDRLVNTALMLYLGMAVVLIAALLVGSDYILSWLFRGANERPQELLQLWRYVLIIIAINIVGLPLYSLITGLQRMDLTAVSSAVCGLFIAALTVVFLWLRWGLPGLVMANLLGGLLNLILFVWMVRRLLPGLALNPLHFRWSELTGIFGFSLQLYTVQMTVAIQNQIEKLYLVRLVGVVPVGWYNIASDVGQKVRRVPELILAPVIAAASELDARGEERRVEELYHRLHKYVACIGLPMCLYVTAMIGPFVDLWLGPSLHVVASPIAALVWVNFLNLAAGPGFLILVGKGLLRAAVNTTLINLFVLVILSFVLIYKLGFAGAVVGILASTTLTTGLFFYWFYRIARYPFWRVIREAYLKPTACSVTALAVLLALVTRSGMGWIGLSVHALAFGVLYLVGLFASRFFDRVDLAQVEGFLPIARFARKIIPAA